MQKITLKSNIDQVVNQIEHIHVLTILSTDMANNAKLRKRYRQDLRKALREYKVLFAKTTRQINQEVWTNLYF